jgi:hypothetical protein
MMWSIFLSEYNTSETKRASPGSLGIYKKCNRKRLCFEWKTDISEKNCFYINFYIKILRNNHGKKAHRG